MKNTEMPLVSIMMPVYNGRYLIGASIESIEMQSYQNWECIIVDDGSTDGTAEYVDIIASRNSKFKVIHHPQNMGRAVARQTALNNCSGEYLAMLDAEDLYHPDKLKEQVELLESNPDIALVSSPMVSFGSKVKDLRVRGGAIKSQIIKFNSNNIPCHASSMLRHQLAKDLKYDSSWSYGEDAQFLREYLVNRVFMLTDKPLYFYSEFDSISKKKLINCHYCGIKEYAKTKQIKKLFTSIFKECFFIVTYPFIPTIEFIKHRGRKLSIEQTEYFNNNIRPLIDKHRCK